MCSLLQLMFYEVCTLFHGCSKVGPCQSISRVYRWPTALFRILRNIEKYFRRTLLEYRPSLWKKKRYKAWEKPLDRPHLSSTSIQMKVKGICPIHAVKSWNIAIWTLPLFANCSRWKICMLSHASILYY